MSSLEENKAIVKKMQTIIFPIMCDIDDFCKENDITYFLSGGTCLGAVRHHGFIPWDDDADLMMPRKDYEKFLALFPLQYSEKYGTGAFSTDPEWQRQFARVWDKKTIRKLINLNDVTMGVFVDILPIDGLPEGKIQRKIFYCRIRLLKAMGYACARKKFNEAEKYRTIKKIAGFVLRPYEMRFFTQRMEKIAKKYDFETSRYVGVSMAAHYGERETIEGEEMRSEVRLQFEGRDFPVPKGYHKYLSNLYGDYMTIPKDAEEAGYSHFEHGTIEFSDE